MRSLFLLAAFAIIALPASAQDTTGAAPSCQASGVHRAFDFWIGTWSVTRPDGQQAGTNRITPILNGCVLLEEWTGAGGGAGSSFNWYDAEAGAWRQLWVDGAGGFMDYRGSLIDGAMRFEGVSVNRDGATTRMRMTFTPLGDGRVRQFIEQSTDGGITWTPWFDGTYTRTDG